MAQIFNFVIAAQLVLLQFIVLENPRIKINCLGVVWKFF